MKKGFFILSSVAIFFCNTPCKAQQNSSGLYYELTTQTHTTQMDVNNYTKIYLAPSGDMRQETKTNLPMMGAIDMITITTKNDPSHVTLINGKAKVYAINAVPTDTVKEDMGNASVINAGKVTLNGFRCTTLEIIDKGDTTRLWISDDVPGNKETTNVLAKVMGLDPNGNFIKYIREKGYKGSWVKFATSSNNKSPDAMAMVMELTKAKYTDVPESMMKVPAGYTETKGDPFAVHYHNETKINEHFKANGKIGK